MLKLISFNFPKLHTKERFAFISIIIFVFWSLVSQTYASTLLTPNTSIALSIITMVIALLGIIKYCISNYLPNTTKVLFFLFIYLLFIGGINGFNLTWGVVDIDFRYSLLFLAGGIFASSERGMLYFHSIMKVLGVFSIVFGILGIILFFKEGYVLESRSATWTQSYFYWWASCSTFAYWGFYSLFCKKDKIIGFSVVLVYFILGMLFLKRIALVNVTFMLLLYVLINKKNRIKNFIILGVSISLLFLLLYYYNPSLFENVWNSLMGRFDNVQNIDEFDRNLEASLYFEKTNIVQILFGNGIGHHVPAPLWSDETILSLHIGWYNFVFKGGIFYFLFMLFVLVKNLVNLSKYKIRNQYLLACCCVGFSFMISLFIEGGWGNTLIPFTISAPIFYSFNKFKYGTHNKFIESSI